MSLKQRINIEKEVTFIKLKINKIEGKLEINSDNKKPEILTIEASDIELKNYDCKYDNLILKNSSEPNNNFNVLKIEIFLDKIEGKSLIFKKIIF